MTMTPEDDDGSSRHYRSPDEAEHPDFTHDDSGQAAAAHPASHNDTSSSVGSPRDTAPDDAARGDAVPGDTAPGETPPGETSHYDASPRDTPNNDISPRDTPQHDASPRDAGPGSSAQAEQSARSQHPSQQSSEPNEFGHAPQAPAVSGSEQPDDGSLVSRSGWRSHTSDEDVDAAFAAIISGIATSPELPAAADRHPSAARPMPDTSDERARRRELRRLERAAEVAAFAAQEAEVQAERDADEAHFEPPEPPPLPRPKGRTIGAMLMLLGGIVLLVRPGLLAVGFDLTMVISVILILGGAAILLTGIWKRRAADADGWDDGAVV